MRDSLTANSILSEVSAILIEPGDDYGKIYQACSRLFQLLAGITALDGNLEGHREPARLPSGKGIGPFWAAMCLQDILRTKKFVRGLYLAIQSAKAKFPGEAIHVLYAGTGPFATLALPMTTLFSPEEVQFTFLEVHAESFQMLQKVIGEMQIQAYVRDAIQVDATDYQCDPRQPVHILLTETMQNGLEKEPQVAIALHLAPQLHPDGIMIPERIDISAGLLNTARELKQMMLTEEKLDDVRLNLQGIFSLDRHTCINYSAYNGFSAIRVHVPHAISSGYSWLCLFTEITVFGAEKLVPGNSGLTLPLRLYKFTGNAAPASEFILRYEMGASPGFRMEIHA